ncbi:MAG: MBL fold metallo-hydrolase [Bacteroidota bacterium]|nr:MBL fold metallo-hydrolase [Bacteroidota bacterium]MDX5430899.1 MBL fold metallo-hydrolase [Bacteroidota bacterium]MDX5469646.1 MBL fold metallo-hydrolase [Bacteroidota bacterium]
MKITFLGTGTSQGVPVIACQCEVCQSSDPRDKRLRSSVLIQEGDINLVIDSGPDFRQQMLRCGIRHLDALVYTHSHKDHIAGMDDVRGFNFITKRPVDIYCTNPTLEALKREFYYAFEEHKYPGVPELNTHRIDAESNFEVKGIPIIPIQVYHYKMPVLGFRVADFTYITDANRIPEAEKEKIKGSKVLVLNALRRSEHISHFSLSEAIDLAKELGAEKTYFIHMSHQMGLHEQIETELPEGMHFSYDGLQLEW